MALGLTRGYKGKIGKDSECLETAPADLSSTQVVCVYSFRACHNENRVLLIYHGEAESDKETRCQNEKSSKRQGSCNDRRSEILCNMQEAACQFLLARTKRGTAVLPPGVSENGANFSNHAANATIFAALVQS